MSRIELVKSLFQEALELPAGADKIAWIRAHAAGDDSLFEEVRSLVEAHAAMRAAAPVSPAAPEPIPAAQFGPYRAVTLLGRGGTSAVYRAERTDGQFQHVVALKVLAAYLSGSDFLRRFDTERQLLAALNHPRITHLLDGGVSSAGDPYLVMEYVDGERLDWYCDHHKLTLERRLRLFLQVCDAVDYAHRHLVVHRDLKPSNILVTADGNVKLLDFGTAALLAAESEVTLTRTRMLTPRYASPERLRGERATPGNDVFSLGVVLYELLTGAWPFGNPDSMLRELQRAMDDAAVVPPATAATAGAAELRAVTFDRLHRVLKGDLEAIALKALESDASRRYGSVRELAEDIERYLTGRPVYARAQTALYRAGKFLRRRWLPASVALFFVLGILTAAIVATAQARAARAEAAKSKKVADFLKQMLSSAAGRNGFTVLEMLAEAEPGLDRIWKDDPLTEAGLRLNLGASYVTLEEPERARLQLDRALALFQAHDDYRGIAITHYIQAQQAELLGYWGRAAILYEQALSDLRRLGKDAPVLWDFRLKQLVARSLADRSHRRLHEAQVLIEEAIAEGQRDSEVTAMDLACARAEWGIVLATEGRTQDAEAAFQQAALVGGDSGGVMDRVREGQIGVAARRLDFAAARDYAHQLYLLLSKSYASDRLNLAWATLEWARFRAETGEAAQALAQVREAMPVIRKHWLPGADALWFPLTWAGHVMIRAGLFPEAERYARESLDVVEQDHREEADARRAESLELLGTALLRERKNPEAIPPLAHAHDLYLQLGPAWTKTAEHLGARLQSAKGHASQRPAGSPR